MSFVSDMDVLVRQGPIVRRRLTVAEYHRMAEAGILGHEERVELIEGEIVVMAPAGSDHSGTVNAVNRLLVRAVGDAAVVAVQNPVRLGEHSEPEPDFALLRPRADDYRGKTPGPDDVLVLIEVAATSLRFDRAVKAPLYARHGIPELWIVDLDGGVVEVHRRPAGDAYAERQTYRRGETIPLPEFPGVAVPVGAILG